MPVRKPALILFLGLGVGVAFDRLFHAGAFGLNVPVTVALILVALFVALYAQGSRFLTANTWLLAPLVFLSASTAVRANPFVTFLNLCAVLGLLSLVAVYYLREPVSRAGLVSYALAPLVTPFLALLRGGQVTRQVATQAATLRKGGGRSWAPAARGLALALPTVFVFGLLLASADSIFSELLGRLVPDNLMDWLQRLLLHGSIALTAGFVIAGGIAYTLWQAPGKSSGVPKLDLGLRRFLGFTEAAIVIFAVDLLFLAFVIVQVPYLFGGQLNVSVEGFTYAEYARRGFGELVGVSVLVLGLLLLLGEFAVRATRRQDRLFTLGNTLMVALTVVILVSAFKRLLLYEIAYGFTEMRLYPHVFMAWLAILLGWFLVTLWWKRARFAIGLLVVCMGFIVTLNVINPDAFIVRQNVARAITLEAQAGPAYERTATERIDASYLTTLSYDAVPDLIASLPRLVPAAQKAVEDHLREQAVALAVQRDTATWPGWHLSRERASASLDLWLAARK